MPIKYLLHIVGTLTFLLCFVVFAQAEEFSSDRPFRGLVRRDTAEQATRLAADIAAYNAASLLLLEQPDLQFLNTPDKDGKVTSPPLDGLVKILFHTELKEIGAKGFPPNLYAIITVKLVTPKDLRGRLKKALTRPDLLELYGMALGEERRILERYDALAAKLLDLRPFESGGKEELHKLNAVLNDFKALTLYYQALPYYENNWTLPDEARVILDKAAAVSPKNPLVLTALAELLLHLNRPSQAMEKISDALNALPDFARAHDVKGTIFLRQSLPVLAAKSFSKAVELSPANQSYLIHRGAANLILEDIPAMCEDFKKACALGNCTEFEWAKNQRKCQ